jgi:hypothetical protein
MTLHAARVVLAAACLFGIQKPSHSAEFVLQAADSLGPVSVLIKGQIKPGDFERFRSFLILPGHLKAYTNYVWLDSIGGNLAEAMKFAHLFEKSSASVVVGPDGKCYSACFMMFASGVDRWLYAFGELGVHQVSVSLPAGLSTMDASLKDNLVRAMTNDASVYLAKQGIPPTLITKMQETPASQMFIINTLMVKREGWQRIMALQPLFLEAVEQACGQQPAVMPAAAWTACRIDFQTKRSQRFVAQELSLLSSGQATLLFAPGTFREAQAAVEAMK